MNNLEFTYYLLAVIILITIFSYAFYSIGWRHGYDDGYDNAHEDFKTIFSEIKKRHQ
tara:strand:- start:220 stop:390 length:171 start_codon:yes stop_codon:yes gene_type:complete